MIQTGIGSGSLTDSIAKDPAVAAPAVEFDHITRRFPGVLALDNVSLRVATGSCHALCGENGAGKSTLARILAGIHAPDAGRLLVHGQPVRFGGPRDALVAGVGMVHQELAFCDNLSVAENLCLGSLPARRGLVDYGRMRERARALLAEIDTSIDVTRPLGSLSIAHQQMIQIAAAVGSGARIIVFDEPTSSLTQIEAERLYLLIDRLRQRNVTCIYVSHRMAEIFRLCDAVSILRDGRHVATCAVHGLSESELVRHMIGRPLGEYFPQHLAARTGKELLRVERLGRPPAFEDISFTLHAGEVVGIAGLVGAGRSALAAALFGVAHATHGAITVDGSRVRIRTPRHAIRLGLGLVPGDRKRQGLVLSETALHNTTLPILERLARFLWIHRSRERALATEFLDRLRLRSSALDAPAALLSGGNQQKLVIARWLAARSRILILNEPTRGVDVGAKAEFHALIDQLAAQGHAILLISSELPELIALSRRILVLRAGRLVADVHREDASQDRLLGLMAGLRSAADAAKVAMPASAGSGWQGVVEDS